MSSAAVREPSGSHVIDSAPTAARQGPTQATLRRRERGGIPETRTLRPISSTEGGVGSVYRMGPDRLPMAGLGRVTPKLGFEALGIIPLESSSTDVTGIAFVLPYTPSLMTWWASWVRS